MRTRGVFIGRTLAGRQIPSNGGLSGGSRRISVIITWRRRRGSGDSEVGAVFVWVGIWVWNVRNSLWSETCYSPSFRCPATTLKSRSDADRSVMRHALAAIYVRYASTIADDSTFGGADGFLTGAKSEKLMLRFERLEDSYE
jgi:hypothetical protein